ncbi:hypothetical protein F9B85_09700 [Heliorestis acidaminivorans]|uniref:Uncharacterized protein n=1 Tax=Heliorestis acidaminivorans TaxID=553427 RepID=A0A6I0F4E6_9FIRM|nr:hypothetical protein [Heliorestis acidaminivorans]KAB2952080.1 hypothetical protein F9B85_09700 [Heliorestis acidaminivorans]
MTDLALFFKSMNSAFNESISDKFSFLWIDWTFTHFLILAILFHFSLGILVGFFGSQWYRKTEASKSQMNEKEKGDNVLDLFKREQQEPSNLWQEQDFTSSNQSQEDKKNF